MNAIIFIFNCVEGFCVSFFFCRRALFLCNSQRHYQCNERQWNRAYFPSFKGSLVVCAVLEIKSHKQCCSCSLASPIPIWCLLSLMFFMLLSRGKICAVYKFKLQRWSRADGSQWKYNYGKGSNEHDNHSKQSISCKMVTQFGGQNGPVEKHLGGSLNVDINSEPPQHLHLGPIANYRKISFINIKL